jgi:hypothetical protein
MDIDLKSMEVLVRKIGPKYQSLNGMSIFCQDGGALNREEMNSAR